MQKAPPCFHLADDVVEGIITTLSRFRSLFVIARNSSFTYKGRCVDVTQIGRELGASFVLEDSVRKSADRVRITPQLIDASTGAHLWADRFHGARLAKNRSVKCTVTGTSANPPTTTSLEKLYWQLQRSPKPLNPSRNWMC